MFFRPFVCFEFVYVYPLVVPVLPSHVLRPVKEIDEGVTERKGNIKPNSVTDHWRMERGVH